MGADNSLVLLRKTRFLEYIRKNNLDGLVLSRIENVRYISGFKPVVSLWFRDAYWAILGEDGETHLVVSVGDYERTRRRMPNVSISKLLSSRKLEIVASGIKDVIGSSGKIGFDSLEFAECNELKKKLPRVNFHWVSGELAKIRSVKLPEELTVIAKGAKITEKAVEAAVKNARDGIKECALAGLAEYEARALGSEGVSWSLATFAGVNAGIFTRNDSERKMKRGEFLIMGYATMYKGYNTDITATTVVGESPTKAQKKTYEAVYDSYKIGLSMAKPGASTKKISDRVARVIEDHGIDRRYSFASNVPLIHGIGMNVYEAPFSPDPGLSQPDHKLVRGHVLAIEPSVAYSDKPRLGGVRLGETITITNDKPQVIGQIPAHSISIFSKK
ncbi:hypothetical protein CL673_09170 [Candidatus Bathyarchaeota archaeon]|nr:hypothetical protein [Candidatus Bathyarchaeota archaeon]